MASKKKAPAPAAQAATQLTVSVSLAVTEETATYYVNAVEVGQSHYEFAMLLGKIPAKLSAEQLDQVQETHKLELPAVLQLLVPPAMIPGLQHALNEERRKYETVHGQKLPGAEAPSSEVANNAH